MTGHPSLDRAQATAAALPPLLVAAQRVAASVTHGLHGRRRAGPGEDFWQFRRYQPGDSPQTIDWRRSARSDPLFVREREWDAAQTVWIACDPSPSMAWTSRPALPTKGARARELALALAALLVRGGERVALIGAEDQRPAQGPAGLLRLALALERQGTQGQALPWPEAVWRTPIARHARLVLIGDLLEPADHLHPGLRRLVGAGVGGHLVQVLDPAEETFPFEGRIRFEGPEDSEESLIVERAQDLRAAYCRRLQAHREALAGLTRRAGWSFALHHTDQPPRLALMALVQALATLPPPRARSDWGG